MYLIPMNLQKCTSSDTNQDLSSETNCSGNPLAASILSVAIFRVAAVVDISTSFGHLE